MKFQILSERKIQKEDELAQLAKDLQYNIPKNVITGIYAIYDVSSNKVYFGQSINVLSRLNKHKSDLANKSHKNKKLQRAYNKSPETLIGFLVQEVPKELLDQAESHYINYFKSHKYGFNKRNKLR